jgi:hypothetical protein
MKGSMEEEAGNAQATVGLTAPTDNGSPLSRYTVTAIGVGPDPFQAPINCRRGLELLCCRRRA